MINRWMGDIGLLIQTKIGVTSAFIVWAAVVAIASVPTFVFLCLTGYDWLSLQLGAAFAGLAMASVFLVIALIGAAFSATSRQRAKQRAMLARAARAQALTPRLLDPKILSVAVQAGRAFGWRRMVTLVLVAVLGRNWCAQPNSEGSTNRPAFADTAGAWTLAGRNSFEVKVVSWAWRESTQGNKWHQSHFGAQSLLRQAAALAGKTHP